MKRMAVKKQRKVLRGWIKWVPVVAIPFAILFFHTWLNIQILRADYVLRELDAEARELADRLNHSGVAETGFEDPEMLAEQARLMDFVQPHPGQRESIPWQQLTFPEDDSFAVAQLDGQRQPDAVSTESTSEEPTNTSEGKVAIATPQPAAVDLDVPVDVQVPQAVESAPIPVAVDVALPISAPTSAPATVVTNVVLDLPEEIFSEEVVDLESAMESLESL